MKNSFLELIYVFKNYIFFRLPKHYIKYTVFIQFTHYINKLHLKYKKCMYIVITKIGLLAVLVCVLDIILVPYFIFKYDAVYLTIKIIFRDVS